MKLSVSAGTNAVTLKHVVFKGTVDDVLDKAKSYGYAGVDLFLRDCREIDGCTLLKATEMHGIKIVMLSAMSDLIRSGITLGNEDKQIREEFLEQAKLHLEQAAHVQAFVPVGYSRGSLDKREPSVYSDVLVESLIRYDALAGQFGVKLVLEPINRYEIDTVNTAFDAVDLIRRGNLKNTGLLLDFFHMNIEETTIEQVIRESRELLWHVHFSDSNRLAPGFGHSPMQKYYKVLKEIGYEGFLGMEVLPRPDEHIAAKQGVTFFELQS